MRSKNQSRIDLLETGLEFLNERLASRSQEARTLSRLLAEAEFKLDEAERRLAAQEREGENLKTVLMQYKSLMAATVEAAGGVLVIKKSHLKASEGKKVTYKPKGSLLEIFT
jgi:ribosomal protein L12E/L44/L45/RPP1/RPP2